MVDGLSTKEVDRLAGLKPGHTWQVEKNTAKRAADTLDRIARVLGLTMDYVIRGDGEPPTAQEVIEAVTRARVAAEQAPVPNGSTG
jgi:transcriptional regulator with XRE-family HTH domain